jgi:hypothetical protein
LTYILNVLEVVEQWKESSVIQKEYQEQAGLERGHSHQACWLFDCSTAIQFKIDENRAKKGKTAMVIGILENIRVSFVNRRKRLQPAPPSLFL